MSRHIRVKRASDVPAREITDESIYLSRRDLLGGAAAWTAAAAVLPWGVPRAARAALDPAELAALAAKRNPRYFYEFGTDKRDPARERGLPAHAPVVGRDRGRGRGDHPGDHRSLEDLLAPTPSRSASTGCAASRRGRW